MSKSLLKYIGYAAPALPFATLYFPVYIYIGPFYATERGVGLLELGALFIAVRLLDAVTDPLMGVISDRFPTRWGRRRPWLVLATPLICVSVWMLMVPAEEAGFTHVAIWLTTLSLSWTVAMTPYFAWGAELSGDYAERSRVTAWREAFTLVGMAAAVILYNVAPAPAEGLLGVALMVVVAMPLAAAAALALTPEPQDYSRTRIKLAEGLRALMRNTLFLRLLLAYFVNGLANGLPVSLFLFFIGDLLGAPDAGWLLLVYFVCAICGMPVWTWAARKMSKHRAWGWAMIYATVLFAPAAFLGQGDLKLFLMVCVATGLALGADLALPPAIQADVVDQDTATGGDQRTGLFFALWSVATKAAVALSSGLAFIALDLAGFQPDAENSAFALGVLAALYAIAPGVLKLIAVALMWNFPLDQAAQERLRADIEAARA